MENKVAKDDNTAGVLSIPKENADKKMTWVSIVMNIFETSEAETFSELALLKIS